MHAIAMFALLVSAPLPGADYVPPEPIPQDIQLAAFRDLIAQKSALVLCLQVNDGDPPADVMARLRDSGNVVVNASQCAAPVQGAYRKSDRRAAEVLRLHNVHVFGDEAATLDAQRFRADVYSSSAQMTLRRHGPAWAVEARTPAPIGAIP